MRVILNGQELKPTREFLTLTAWKAMLQPGRKMVCTYRWYWKDKPSEFTQPRHIKPDNGRQVCTIANVRATQMNYTVEGLGDLLTRFDYPRASELRATKTGFELYFPEDPKLGDRSGILMSRYEWLPIIPPCDLPVTYSSHLPGLPGHHDIDGKFWPCELRHGI